MCYVHFPFFYGKKEGVKSILNSLLLNPVDAFKYDIILCNSNFTKKEIQKYVKNKKVEVVYHHVKTEVKKRKKKNLIISVGRFLAEKKN